MRIDSDPAELPVIGRLVLFGATGDLAGRYLLPALAGLHAAGKLPEGFQVVGAATQDWDDLAFRRTASERLMEHAADVPAAAREALVRSLRYRRVDIEDASSVALAIREEPTDSGTEPVAAYLALPTGLFPAAVSALGAAGLPPGSRIALEKPFGENLESAVALNAQLARLFGEETERVVFRVDHFLGLATVRNLLGLRLANRVLDAVWNGVHIEQVDIVWDETLALEGRAAYYDRAGALRDVLQNHLVRVLCLLALEPPSSLREKELRDCKLDVLRSVRPLTPGEMASRTRRARYAAGRLESGRAVPAYAEEAGVDPARCTESFAEVVLELETERWTGTRFLLRTAKALARDRMEVVVRFRPLGRGPFGGADAAPAANELRIDLAEPESLTLRLTGSTPGPPLLPLPLALTAQLPEDELSEYGRVLLDILSGGSTLSVRGDEAEEAWRVMTPVLQAWAAGEVPLEEYPAGSSGPPPR